jgi:hypothetical protein
MWKEKVFQVGAGFALVDCATAQDAHREQDSLHALSFRLAGRLR